MPAPVFSPTTPRDRRRRAGRCLATGAIFLIFTTLVWLSTRQPGGSLGLFERGHWLGPASDMLAGKIPYRDTFPVHGFLADGGLDSLLFLLLGPSFSVSLHAHHLLGVLLQPALFLVTAAATRRPLLAAACIPMYLGFATGIVADRPVLPLLSLAAFALALEENPKRTSAFLAGTLAGLGVLYALDFGTFVLLAEFLVLIVCSLWTPRRAGRSLRVGAFFLGLAAAVFPFLAYLGMHSAVVPFLETSFVELPRHIDRVWGWPFPAPWDLVRTWSLGQPYRVGDLPIGLGIAKRLYLAPVLGGLGVALGVFLSRRIGLHVIALRLLVVSLACAFFFRYVVGRLHLEAGNALTGPVVVLVLAGLYESFWRHRPRAAQTRGVVVLVLVALASAVTMNAHGWTGRLVRNAIGYGQRMGNRSELVPLTVPRGGRTLVPPHEAADLSALFAFSERASSSREPILDLTNRPGLYFFLRRENATRFYQVPLMQPFQDEVLESLSASRPAFVLITSNGPLDAMDGIPNSQRIPRVWAHVQAAYPRRIRVADTVVALPETRVLESHAFRRIPAAHQ